MKINAGCGRRVLPGWTNVDYEAHAPGVVVCDLRDMSCFEGCTVETVQAIHVIEHFYLWEAGNVLAEFFRILEPGGLLILELPNLLKCCGNLIEMRVAKHPGQLDMWGIYGDPAHKNPLMCHRWGWTPGTVIDALWFAGFSTVQEKPTQNHPAGRDHRDMRLEAHKPKIRN